MWVPPNHPYIDGIFDYKPSSNWGTSIDGTPICFAKLLRMFWVTGWTTPHNLYHADFMFDLTTSDGWYEWRGGHRAIDSLDGTEVLGLTPWAVGYALQTIWKVHRLHVHCKKWIWESKNTDWPADFPKHYGWTVKNTTLPSRYPGWWCFLRQCQPRSIDPGLFAGYPPTPNYVW